MEVTTIYDTGNPELNLSPQTLLHAMYLEKEFELELPNGDFTMGVLKGVSSAVEEIHDGRLIELTLEIDDRFQDLFNPPVNEEFVPARYSYPHIEGYCE